MTYSANVHVAVYQVLDQVLTGSAPPPGAKAAIHSIIDDLKIACAPREMVGQAESISLQLHQLETALSRGEAGKVADARQMLRSIAASWLNYRIVGRSC
jgi:hypothetical protein